VIDGELVAIDNDGRPDFNLLQNYRSSEANLAYLAFDILAHKGESLLELPLVGIVRIKIAGAMGAGSDCAMRLMIESAKSVGISLDPVLLAHFRY
jgi:hypothetical protein